MKDRLTPRETEIMLMIAEGQSYSEIAEKLCITPSTLRIHACRIRAQLGIPGGKGCLADSISPKKVRQSHG